MSSGTDPAIRQWSDFAVGSSVRSQLQFSKDDLHRFAELSGDQNPLHLDPVFARSRGFDAEVVYGGLIYAKLSRILGMLLPGRDGLWISVRLDFRESLLVDEPAEMVVTVTHLSEAVRLLTLGVEVLASSRCIVRGTAEAILLKARERGAS
jgi:hypothetical protein